MDEQAFMALSINCLALHAQLRACIAESCGFRQLYCPEFSRHKLTDVIREHRDGLPGGPDCGRYAAKLSVKSPKCHHRPLRARDIRLFIIKEREIGFISARARDTGDTSDV
jgi:hypothetical protein